MADLLHETNNNILTITLNRPDRLNAMSNEMRESLMQLLTQQTSNPSVRAVVIRANGRGFCTGADVQPEQILARRANIGEQVKKGINQVIKLITSLPVPVVAAVNGPAAGAGVSLALASDLMLVNRDAAFHLSFARIGAVMDGGSSWFLTRAIGARRTAALALTGGNFRAEEALSWGLAHKVVDNDRLWEEANELAKQLASGPTTALGLIKKEIAMAATLDLNSVLDLEAECQQTAFNTSDFAEAIEARQQKRSPEFKGH
ncbi:enoyl-CoA hydratase-related protein [Marinobacter sp. ANT_B65]|uniref:enoyl-CoA hydratase-related protein n=1 Tax=Marinobacter sp. ANT_B65 TaxID=2039467 RepID=UPI000BBF08B9|nr:enoyl-CoA hydratase-related protein [Marinobacter sp. ANT_B65]PCM43291.1 enoyl-CoA hydratase [Marinobacter sp. ANT_B65]